MTEPSTEHRCGEAVSFRDSNWKTRWLFLGLAILIVWRSTALLDRGWLSIFPWWLLLAATSVVPQVFLLLFPIITRRPRGRLRVPVPTRCLIELGIALPVAIASIAALSFLNYVLGHLSPGTTLEPDAYKDMAKSSRRNRSRLGQQ